MTEEPSSSSSLSSAKQQQKQREKVYVLFGSQTDNSEDAARTFAKELPAKLNPSRLKELTGTTKEILLDAVPMQLDDFLELGKEGTLFRQSPFVTGSAIRPHTTFFQNPTAIDQGMLHVGAQRIGEVGQADARENGTNNSQANVIARWKEALCEPQLWKTNWTRTC